MSILIDTNVLLRRAQVASQHHQTAVDSIQALVQANLDVCLVPQVIYEFWVAATRPVNVNGLGMDVAMVKQSVHDLMRDFVLLRDEPGIFRHWLSLVEMNNVQGKPAHDARLVAAMQQHGVQNLLTFNVADFARFPTINVFSPADILAGKLPV